MQIRENWAWLHGRVLRVEPGPHGCDAVIEVDRVEDVPGYPNLVRAEKGNHVRVRVNQGLPAPLADTHVQLRVRRGGPGDLLFGSVDGKRPGLAGGTAAKPE